MQWLCPPVGKTRNNLFKCSMSTIPSSEACWVPGHSPAFLGCSRELDGLLTHHLVPGFFLSSTCCQFLKSCSKNLSCACRLATQASKLCNKPNKRGNPCPSCKKDLKPWASSLNTKKLQQMVSTKTHPINWAIITNVKLILTLTTVCSALRNPSPHLIPVTSQSHTEKEMETIE